MFNEIETKFKEKSQFNLNSKLLISLAVVYIVAAFFISKKYENDFNLWIAVIPAIAFYVVIYIYMIGYNIKYKVYNRKNWWKVIHIENSYIEFKKVQREQDKNLLVSLLEEKHVNTRPKVANILEHYRVLLPRTIIGGGQFMAILALIISVESFIFSSNLKEANERAAIFGFNLGLLAILWIMFSSATTLIGNIYSKKSFYVRMEDILTEIYINKDIE